MTPSVPSPPGVLLPSSFRMANIVHAGPGERTKQNRFAEGISQKTCSDASPTSENIGWAWNFQCPAQQLHDRCQGNLPSQLAPNAAQNLENHLIKVSNTLQTASWISLSIVPETLSDHRLASFPPQSSANHARVHPLETCQRKDSSSLCVCILR